MSEVKVSITPQKLEKYKALATIIDKFFVYVKSKMVLGAELSSLRRIFIEKLNKDLSLIYTKSKKGFSYPLTLTPNYIIQNYTGDWKIKSGDLIKVELELFIDDDITVSGAETFLGDEYLNEDFKDVYVAAYTTSKAIADKFYEKKVVLDKPSIESLVTSQAEEWAKYFEIEFLHKYSGCYMEEDKEEGLKIVDVTLSFANRESKSAYYDRPTLYMLVDRDATYKQLKLKSASRVYKNILALPNKKHIFSEDDIFGESKDLSQFKMGIKNCCEQGILEALPVEKLDNNISALDCVSRVGFTFIINDGKVIFLNKPFKHVEIAKPRKQ